MKWIPHPETWHEVAIVEEEAQLDLFGVATPKVDEYNKPSDCELLPADEVKA